jgi:hypothetical protein
MASKNQQTYIVINNSPDAYRGKRGTVQIWAVKDRYDDSYLGIKEQYTTRDQARNAARRYNAPRTDR